MTPEQRQRVKLVGRQAFIREEMTKLGFWPPNLEVQEKAAEAEKQLKALYAEMAKAQTDLSQVETQIAESGDIAKLLLEVRRKRIERVRAERAVKREERTQEKARKLAEETAWRRKTLPFLGAGVSSGLVYEGGDAAKVAALGLPPLATASDVAGAIGIAERELAFLCYHRGAATTDHYSRFLIPKRRGGMRVISSPKPRLRVAQSWLLAHVLTPLPVHEAAMAFRPGLSVADNAAQHVGRAIVARIDLKDFFPSVTLPRVRSLFQSFGYNGGVATLLALLATESPRTAVTLDGTRRFVALGERCLPQGACTSPALTNLLCRRLDARLAGAAKRLGFTYTRYADDLVFSHADAGAPVGMLLTLARAILTDVGFVGQRGQDGRAAPPAPTDGYGRGGQRDAARLPRRSAPLPRPPAPVPNVGRRCRLRAHRERRPRPCQRVSGLPAHGQPGAGPARPRGPPVAVAEEGLGGDGLGESGNLTAG